MNVCQMDVVKKVFSSFFRVAQSWNGNWLCSLTLGELSCRLLLLLLLLFPEPREYTMSLMAPMGLQDGSETSKGQVVVGCPPIGTYRSKTRATAQPRSPQYVKVNMDGVPIGRKVDLNAHESYETLAQALEDMFQWPNNVNGQSGTQTQMEKGHVGANDIKHSRLLDSSSAFALTYEDKEGDWMLVGDVPWRMFVNTIKRLRIMKTSDANGLDSRQVPIALN